MEQLDLESHIVLVRFALEHGRMDESCLPPRTSFAAALFLQKSHCEEELMGQPETHAFQVGDRVKVVVDLPMAHVGEQGRITAIHHDADNCPRSLTVLIDHNPATTRGITVLPREIAAVEKEDVELSQS